MDKLIIPKGCEIIGEVHGLIYPGDIEIREPFHARELTSREGSITFESSDRDAALEMVEAAKTLQIQAGQLQAGSFRAGTLELEVAGLASEGDLEATLTFGLISRGAVSFRSATCAEGDLTIEAQTLEGETVSGGEVTLSFENGRLSEIRGHKVVINGNLQCDRIVAEETVQCIGGQIRIKHVESPSFRADPSVTGIVMVATCEDVKAEGVRGFLHPSELDMLSASPPSPPAGVRHTVDLGPVVAETPEPAPVDREEEPVELTSADLDDPEGGAEPLYEIETVEDIPEEEEAPLADIGEEADEEDGIADPFADAERSGPLSDEEAFDTLTADLPVSEDDTTDPLAAEPIQVNTDDFTNMETFDEPGDDNPGGIYETFDEVTAADLEAMPEQDDLYGSADSDGDDVLEDEGETLVEEMDDELAEELPDELAEELPDELTEELPDELTEELPDELAEELPDELAEELPEELDEAVIESDMSDSGSFEDPVEAELEDVEVLEPDEDFGTEEVLVRQLNQILDQIKAFFPEENYPQSIDQIRGYVANGQLNLFRRARNRESVIKNFQKFQHEEIDILITRFFDILDTYFENP